MPESGLLGYPGKGPPVDLDPNTQLFTSSGTWTKPGDCQWVRVILVGGGGGGGGGRKAVNYNTGSFERAQGGGGGGGGGVSFIDLPAGALPSTVPITIGAGGSGGAGATSDGTNGTAGTAGGNSTFGDLLVAEGGNGGHAGASGDNSCARGGRGLLSGGYGSRNTLGATQPGHRWVTTSGGSAGAGSGDNSLVGRPSAPTMATSPFSEPFKFSVLGTSGNGGEYGLFSAATNGKPGNFGNGGGGGGGGKIPNNAGNGGNGGNGYCLIVCYGTRYRPVDVQVFPSNGTWRKPSDPRLTTARAFVMGGGGGGGSGRRGDRTRSAYLTGSFLDIAFANTNYASTADNAAIDITGDIDVKVKVGFYNWSQSAMLQGYDPNNRRFRTVMAKWTESGNQRSWRLEVDSGGGLRFGWSNNGSSGGQVFSNGSLTLSRYTVKWIRATLDVNNGSGSRVWKFYTSDDGSSWTQLGSTITESGTAALFNSTAPLTFGSSLTNVGQSEVRIYRAIIENGYDGAGTVVYDADFETQPAGTTSFTESSASGLTVSVTNTNCDLYGGGGGNGGAISYAELPLAELPTSVDVTVGAGGAGGAGITSDYESGEHGQPGQPSSFGDYVYAVGGEQGYGGSTFGGASSTAQYTFPNNTLSGSSISCALGSLTAGGSGGRGGTTTGNSPLTSSFEGAAMNSGGGGGGGINSSGTTGAGGSAPRPLGYGAALADVAAAGNGTELFTDLNGMFGSTGGGGGNSNAATVDGGSGGRGSGGGGGAATANGTTSGAGGNGGDGYVVVVCV